MEISNIWTALSTENPKLITIILHIAIFIESYLILNLFLSIFNIKSTSKQRILYVILYVVEGTLSSLYIPSPYNLIINYLILFLIVYFIFKLKPIKVILCVIIPIIFFGLLGSLIMNPYLTLFNITYEQTESIPIYRLGYLAIMYTIVGLIIGIIRCKNFKITILEEIDKKTKLVIISNFILGLIVLCIQLFINFYYINEFPLIITFLNFISLFAYFFISTYSLTRVTKLYKTQKQLENSEAYNKSLSILHDNIRCFKHDFDNIVATIGGYVKTNDMEGLKKYYYQLEDDCQRVNNIATLSPEIINNPGVYSILSSKYHKADEKNIKINLEFFLDLNTLNMKIYEFTRMFGILLDNAIEATSECEEKLINIKFRNEPNKNRQLVIVENTFNDKNLNIDEIFQKGVSGKENHTGLGLWEVRKILKKNNNLNLYTKKDNDLFIQQLEIYY